MTKGFTGPEVKGAYDRAYGLCGQIGESAPPLPRPCPACSGSSSPGGNCRVRGRSRCKLLRLAQAQPDPLLLPAAHVALGVTLFHLGEPTAARRQVEQGLGAYDRHQQEALILQYGEDVGCSCSCTMPALALQVLGYPDQALARSQEALVLAEALSHPLIRSRARPHCLFLSVSPGRPDRASAGRVGHRPGSRAWVFAGVGGRTERSCGVGACGAGTGRRGDCAHAPRPRGLSDPWGRFLRPYHLGLLAEALGKAGRAQEGLTVLGEALATARRTGERWYDAELHRLQGELTPERRDLESQAAERSRKPKRVFSRPSRRRASRGPSSSSCAR